MLDLATLGLPIDVSKFNNSPEFSRLLKSVHQNIKQEMANPESSIGLALNALLFQLSTNDSQVLNEANLTFIERNTLTPIVGKLYSALKE